MNAARERICGGCGQPIPPSAQLTAEVVTPEQLAALGGEASEHARAELCLACRVRLARLGVRS